jgi:hypothetical protein
MKSPKPCKSKQSKDVPNNPAYLFHYFRKLSIDPTKSETERNRARNDMMDVWSVLPWGLAANILDMKD